MWRFLVSYNLLYKSVYIFIVLPSKELSQKDLKFLSFQVYLPLHISLALLWWDRIINIDVHASWIMHLNQEILLFLSYILSPGTNELQPL